MKFIDLFAGIGGFRKGMKEHGHECVLSCEIDNHARKSYAAIHGIDHDFPRDVTKLLDNEIDNKFEYDVLCADLEGIALSKINLNHKWAIIFGSEAHGISSDFDTFNKVTIKGSNSIESLNVSVASGIILQHLINNY